jgi:multiple sugar transport system permease protein
VATAVAAIAGFNSSLGGYIFAKFEFPLKQPLLILILITLMIPFPVLLIPNYIIANRLGVLNSLWALVLPGMVSAFGIFLIRQFAAGIPRDLIEAARLDGASEWAIFGRIVLPLLRPALAALGVFTFLASWNDYLWPLVAINDLDKSTLPLALTFFNSLHATRYDLVMAAATMAVVPVLVIFLLFQRHIVKALVLAGMR